jgi:hypothetical protein
MKGVIEFADRARGRYAVQDASGDYTIFELHEHDMLEVGSTVSGDLGRTGEAIYSVRDEGSVRVIVEDCFCTRAAALRWVAGS